MAFFYTSNIVRDMICAWYGKGNITRNTVHVRYKHFTNLIYRIYMHNFNLSQV